jgi:hypothetical protein
MAIAARVGGTCTMNALWNGQLSMARLKMAAGLTIANPVNESTSRR